MPDGILLDIGSGGANLLTDEITTGANSGQHAQRSKIVFGGDGVFQDVGSVAPFPVDFYLPGGQVPSVNSGVADAGTLRVVFSASQPAILVDGSAVTQPISAASLPLPSGAATAALQLPDGHNVGAPNDGSLVAQLGDGTNLTIVNAAGELMVDEPNLISTNNSTIVTLGIGANFTGTGDDVSDYSAVTIQIDASHDSAVDGMTFEFSIDNVNWDDTFLFTYTAADGARRFQFPTTAQFFRVNYTNGGTGQSHFRVQTILHRHAVTSSVRRLVDNEDPDRSSVVVKSILMAQAAGAGDFIPIQASAGGNFKVDLEDIGGVAVDVNSGPAGDGTQRVFISTDQTVIPFSAASLPLPAGAATSALQLPNDHDVTVTTFPANQPFNLNQIGGAAIAVNSGNASAGTQRVIIAADQDPISVDGSGFTQPISAAALPLPSGAATAAAQLADGHNVTVDNAAADGVPIFAVESGTNTEVKFGDDGNSAVRVNVVAGSAGGTEFNEDAPSAGGEAGALALGYRQDADTSPVDTDGDFHGLIFDAAGNLKVNVKLGSAGGVSHVDDAPFTPGSDDVVPMAGYFAADASPDNVTSGDAGVVRMSANRNLFTVLRDAAGNERGVNVTAANALTVDGSAVTQPISAASLPLPSGAATSALQLADGHNVVVTGFPDNEPFDMAQVAGTATSVSSGNTDAGTQRVILASDQPVILVDGSGVTQPISAAALPLPSGAATSALQLAAGHTVVALGTDAVGSPATDVPVQAGIEARTTLPTAVDDTDVVRPMADDLGRQVVIQDAPRDLVTQNLVSLTGTGEVTLIAAGGAGVFRDLTDLHYTNGSTTGVWCEIRQSSGGPIAHRMFLAASGGGAVPEFKKPLQQDSANQVWTAKLATAVNTVSVYACAVNQN